MAVQAGRSESGRKPSNDKETTVLTYLSQMVIASGPFGLLTSGLLVVNTAMRVGRDYPVSNCGAKYLRRLESSRECVLARYLPEKKVSSRSKTSAESKMGCIQINTNR